eukprot:UN07516
MVGTIDGSIFCYLPIFFLDWLGSE